MKYIKLILIILIAFNITGCFEDTTIDDEIAGTPNLVTFSRQEVSASATADGSEYTKEVNLKFIGPRLDEVKNQVTVNVSVDESSTAVEGTHYRLDQTQITFGPDDNFLAKLPFTMLTAGIQAPLEENPELVLNLENASGDPSVIASGKKLKINLLYLCFADLSGTYLVTNDNCDTGGYTIEISQNPDGSWYLESADGGFLGHCTANTGLANFGTINVVCGEVQPSDDLEYVGCCDIGNIQGGTWDQQSGVLIMEHTQEFTPNWAGSWKSTYTRL